MNNDLSSFLKYFGKTTDKIRFLGAAKGLTYDVLLGKLQIKACEVHCWKANVTYI